MERPRTKEERNDERIDRLVEYKRTGFFPEKTDITEYSGMYGFVVIKDTCRGVRTVYYAWDPRVKSESVPWSGTSSTFHGSRAEMVRWLAENLLAFAG